LTAGVGGVAAGAASSPAATTPTTSLPTSIGQAQQQLAAGQRRVSQLAGTVAGAGRQTGDLGASVATLQDQVARLQGDLSARRRQLLRVRDELDAAQIKLGGLEAAKAAAERVLGEELVGNYEGRQPDIISVVLESNGFADLLERLAFAQRVSRQDARIVGHVRSARRAVATEAKTLGRLTARAQNVAESVLSERNRVAQYRLRLVAQQLTAAKAKATAAGQLGSAQAEVAQLTQQLAGLRSAQPSTPASSASGTGAATPAAGIPFPLPAGNVAPPATWSVGEGVNIAAPAGTPELALCSGTIVLHGIGGLGPWAPVLRCDQPLSGHSYVYYGYAGPKRLASIGANVARGQPLARVADGTVGISAGPHLEIGFADSSGAPLGSASARQMMTLLRSAFAT
jgi:murein DD-endopeptidase MepM/ murein hydrolase activator NlpD